MPKGVFERSPEHRKNIAAALTGIKRSDETKRKLSEMRKGIPWSDPDGSRRAALRARTGELHPTFGKELTPEWKEKLSKARKGRSFLLAKKYGISIEEYVQNRSDGNRWCWFKKHFAPEGDFARATGTCNACKSEAYRHADLKSLCGVDQAWYEAKLAEQGGVCALCGRFRPSSKNNHMHVDHDHKTGAARGILCSRCNHVIERFEDTPDLAIKAMSYLLRYK